MYWPFLTCISGRAGFAGVCACEVIEIKAIGHARMNRRIFMWRVSYGER
jgi:hypothetical protein